MEPSPPIRLARCTAVIIAQGVGVDRVAGGGGLSRVMKCVLSFFAVLGLGALAPGAGSGLRAAGETGAGGAPEPRAELRASQPPAARSAVPTVPPADSVALPATPSAPRTSASLSSTQPPSPPPPPAPRADRREESLSERGLRQLVERQRALFEAAAASEKAGRFDEGDFAAQVQQLCRAYESLLSENPKFAAGYAAYGYLLGKIGMEDESVALLLKANQYDPEIPLVKNQIGNYLAEHGKPLEAVNYYLAAIRLAPEEPLYHYQLGTLLHNSRAEFVRSGDWEADAVDSASHEGFRKAAELAPERFEFVYRYGESFYDVPEPDWDAALEVWGGLESRSGSEIERQVIRLHAAKVCLESGRREHALALLGTIDEPTLASQREKLVAQAQGADDK